MNMPAERLRTALEKLGLNITEARLAVRGGRGLLACNDLASLDESLVDAETSLARAGRVLDKLKASAVGKGGATRARGRGGR